MAPSNRNTVERLDKPSSYAASKVAASISTDIAPSSNFTLQNRRRKYNRDGDEGDRREKTPEFEDKLKDATTLYVGNLYVR